MINSIPGFQDPVSSWSHLVGAIVFAALIYPMMVKAKSGHFFLWIYCITIVMLFGVSGSYHILGPGIGREVMLRIDLSAIFLLIVGTMTPIHGLLFQGWARWIPLAILWGIAATFIPLVCVFYGTIPRWVWILVQVGLGWFGAIVGSYLAWTYGWKMVRGLLIGGICYTVGAIINAYGWPTIFPGVFGPHELFHVFVLAGAYFHWQFIYDFVGERPKPKVRIS